VGKRFRGCRAKRLYVHTMSPRHWRGLMMPTPTRDVFGMFLLLLALMAKNEGPMEETK